MGKQVPTALEKILVPVFKFLLMQNEMDIKLRLTQNKRERKELGCVEKDRESWFVVKCDKCGKLEFLTGMCKGPCL